jgi:oxygen-dependent protoporphyrinogen oxidase
VADGWRVRMDTSRGRPEELSARRVVLAVPAAAAARLIAPLSSEAAGLLDAIPYAPIVSVGLGYARDRVRHPLDGFGFLVPRREGLRTLGGLFSSTLFPGRAPSGTVLVTAFIGGIKDPEAVTLDDDAVIACLGNDLVAALGVDGPPAMARLTRYQGAIPQYTLGQLDRVARVEALLAGYPGLHLRASWRDGISVADCVHNGEVLAEWLSGAVD